MTSRVRKVALGRRFRFDGKPELARLWGSALAYVDGVELDRSSVTL